MTWYALAGLLAIDAVIFAVSWQKQKAERRARRERRRQRLTGAWWIK
jgi:hypothetical protein